MAGQINIGDTWKNISAMNINIGDTWKSVAAAQVNIGDSWKTWWPTTASIDGKYIYLYNSAGTTLKSDDYGASFNNGGTVSAYYSDIACDGTGKYVLCDQGAPVKVSSNYGASYSRVTVTDGFAGMWVNRNGSVMVCGGSDGKIRISLTSGTTWGVLDLPGTAAYYGVCGNLNGNIQYYSGGNATIGGIYKSINYGSSYSTLLSGITNLRWCCCSGDGSYVTVAKSGGYLYVSNNSGQTFSTKCVSAKWYSVAMSLSGQYQIAGSEDDTLLYVSSNYGQTWTNKTIFSAPYYGVDCSGSGKIMVVGGWGGNSCYISTDYGQTWSTLSTTGNYAGVAINKYQ
jgi:hypothetical protein